MKLVSFLVEKKQSYGLKTNRGIIDLGKSLSNRYLDLQALIADEKGLAVASTFLDQTPDYQDHQVTFLPVIQNPKKIVCVGMNYADKCLEFGVDNSAPILFIRFPDSQTGHNCALMKPKQSDEFDYEGELAVVMGKTTKHISANDALKHVAGYSCYMDGSVRDWQYSWFTAGKNWQHTGGFGPWLVTRDEVTNPQHLLIETRLNGCIVQHANTASMIHSIAEIIEYISTFTVLSPGDVIITGSPGGVGKKRTPPLFLHEGDIVEVEIEKVGCLRNFVSSNIGTT